MVQKVSTIVFLIAIGLNLIWVLAYTGLVTGVATLIAGIVWIN